MVSCQVGQLPIGCYDAIYKRVGGTDEITNQLSSFLIWAFGLLREEGGWWDPRTEDGSKSLVSWLSWVYWVRTSFTLANKGGLPENFIRLPYWDNMARRGTVFLLEFFFQFPNPSSSWTLCTCVAHHDHLQVCTYTAVAQLLGFLTFLGFSPTLYFCFLSSIIVVC